MRAVFASILTVATLALAFSMTAGAAELRGTVIGVADGDTLTVLDKMRHRHTVRLAGVDAPERRQPYGERAKLHLVRLALNRSVLVDWHKRDRYGRLVGRVLAAECEQACPYAKDIALEQLAAGLAWHFDRYAAEQPLAERLRYARAEREARARREGLWREPDPVPPWRFREHRTPAHARAESPAAFGLACESC